MKQNPATGHWALKSRRIAEVVRAGDQFEAWDTLKDRPIEDFGLIVTAEPGENADPIGVHTSMLMFRWHRDDDARAFIELAVGQGLPDTTEADMAAAGRIG